MKITSKIVLIILFSIAYQIHAQQTIKKDTINGTELTITMDTNVAKQIESLEEKCATSNEKIIAAGNKGNNKIIIPSRALTNEEISRKNPRISGYKIQVVVVKSNDEANKIRSEFRTKFPNLKVEIDASLRPNYKILAGSYFTKQSSSPDLKLIRKQYNTAIPIQYRIFCAEAK